MIAQVHSATLIGIEALPIVVEMDLQGRIDGEGERYFILVGLPDKAVQESKERVRTAVRNSGLKIPCNRHAPCESDCLLPVLRFCELCKPHRRRRTRH